MGKSKQRNTVHHFRSMRLFFANSMVHNVSVTTPYGKELPFVATEGTEGEDSRSVVWFDIDNCLYSKRLGIDRQMGVLIKAYFAKIGLPREEAERLHLEYYKSYGLAIRGLGTQPSPSSHRLLCIIVGSPRRCGVVEASPDEIPFPLSFQY